MKDYLIITFCNDDYKNLAIIWENQLKKVNINNYIVISTDNEAYLYLKSHNVNTKLDIYDKSVTFWVYRMNIFRKLFLENEYKYYMHCDLDAIIKKPFYHDLINNYPNIDMFFSQGTIFPKQHLEKHNFVLCCGFFCLKSNKNVKKFLKNYCLKLKQINDDQIAINLELIDTVWQNESLKKYELPKGKKKFTYYDQNITGFNSTYNLKTMLISFFNIQRIKINNDGYIYHPLTPKKCNLIITSLKNSNII